MGLANVAKCCQGLVSSHDMVYPVMCAEMSLLQSSMFCSVGVRLYWTLYFKHCSYAWLSVFVCLSVCLSVYVHCSVVTLLARYNDIELLRKAVSKQKVNIVLTAAARVRACVQMHVIGWLHVIAIRTRRHLAGNVWKRFDVHLLYEISYSWYALNQFYFTASTIKACVEVLGGNVSKDPNPKYCQRY